MIMPLRIGDLACKEVDLGGAKGEDGDRGHLILSALIGDGFCV